MARKTLADWFVAAAYAQAGEPEMALECLDSQRRVLLALSPEHFDALACDCAEQLATRLKVGLEVLWVGASGVLPGPLKEFLAALGERGIARAVTHGEGDLADALSRHSRKDGNVICAVVPAGLGQRRVLAQVGIPVVTATGCATAT